MTSYVFLPVIKCAEGQRILIPKGYNSVYEDQGLLKKTQIKRRVRNHRKLQEYILKPVTIITFIFSVL